MCFTRGIRLMNHSPTSNTDAPIHDDTNTPTRNMKTKDVTNPSPANLYSDTHLSQLTHGY